MLGEMIGEESGTVTGTRMLPSDGQSPKMEVSFQASGKVLGVEGTDMGTYTAVLRPDGTLYGEGQGCVMFRDGSVATWTGQGIGRMTGRGTAVSWRGSIYFHTASSQLARLNGVPVVYEYEVDENGKTHTKSWEWK